MPHYTLFGPSCLPAFVFDFKKKVLTYHKTGQPGLSCQKFIASASGNGVRVVNGLVNGIVIRVINGDDVAVEDYLLEVEE